tara:strand:+ start:19708 stop:19965 length:258 start_codon:yes stop_codon:yes gene_type:complete
MHFSTIYRQGQNTKVDDVIRSMQDKERRLVERRDFLNKKLEELFSESEELRKKAWGDIKGDLSIDPDRALCITREGDIIEALKEH